MAELYTCIECEDYYDDKGGDTDERMCYKCIDEIYTEKISGPKFDTDDIRRIINKIIAILYDEEGLGWEEYSNMKYLLREFEQKAKKEVRTSCQ
jgi:hypothetical protein